MDTKTSIDAGVNTIKQHVKSMPSCPGVYRMLDEQNNILYIGKARNLKKRVVNYTHPEKQPYRIKAMISYTRSMEITTTETEAEALLLEANLIKKHEPRYNILLKDDKSYPYILITEDHDYPRICKHRGIQNKKGSYYGPFSSAGAVKRVIQDLQKIFLLRPCTDSYFKNRKKPCMEYQIKRCSAPCVAYISKEDYHKQLAYAYQFLKGKTDQIQKYLAQLMEKESKNLNYEKAAHYRDRIQALNHIQLQQSQQEKSLEEADVIAIANESETVCINVTFYRGKQDYGNQIFFPKHTKESTLPEILAAFLTQFYQTHTPPKHIYLSHAIDSLPAMKEALSSLAPYSVTISVPKQGNKFQAVNRTLTNAYMALQQKLSSQYQHRTTLQALVSLFDLPRIPLRIEVYDNSHISGTHKVGAMIVVGESGFDKKSYRKFTIKESTNGGDDYAMMREVLRRRLTNLIEEYPEYQPHIWPDLLLIDGGAGQLSSVQSILDELKLSIPVVAIAKGPERNAGREVFYFTHKPPYSLPENDPVLYFLQRIRDEAHRFVIGAHRKKRKKALTQSALDSIHGIGAKRKKALLQFFGSVQEVKNAAPHELAKVEGISNTFAQQIYDYFR